jgi:hypothetical protein
LTVGKRKKKVLVRSNRLLSFLSLQIIIYREDFKSLDEFTAMRFTGTGAPPAARSIRNVPMNKPITFGMKGSNSPVDLFTALCFTASSVL